MTTTPIAVTAGTLTRNESTRGQKWQQLRGWRLSAIKNDDTYEDGDLKGLNPCDCWYFRDARNVRGVKIDDSYEGGSLEASTMKTPRGSIPVTVAWRVGGGGADTIGGAAGEPRTENIYSTLGGCKVGLEML